MPPISTHFKTLATLHPSLRTLATTTTSDSVATKFDPETVDRALVALSNDWRKAVDLFNWLRLHHRFHHTTLTFNRTIDIVAKFFEFDLAWSLVHQMFQSPSSAPDHRTFRILFNRYAAAHLVDDALLAFRRSSHFGLHDRTSFSNLIDALCEHKHVLEAQDLCRHSQFSSDTKIWNMILRGYFKMAWWRRCRDIWDEMARRGVPRDLHSYSVYMHIQCEAGKPWRAVRLFWQMKTEGITPDAIAYNTVLHALGRTKGADEAIRMHREMTELGCHPNVVTYNTIIKLLCEEERVRQAFGFLEQMRKRGCAPNTLTYHCFFKRLKRPKEILRLFERMIESGCEPRVDTYVMLIKKFGNWGFLRPVLLVWDKMKERGCSPDACAYNALIDALLQKGMVEMAREYDQEMLEKELSGKPRKELGTKLSNGESDNESD